MTDEEIGLNLMMTGNDKSPLPSGWDPCSDSVMNALFRKGCFHHILEDIFYLLEPKTLFNCSLVCRDWNLYLKKLVWCNAQGERRITDNWLHMSPLMKEIPVPLTPEETKQLRQLSDNQESRLQCPMFIVMIDEDLICAVAGRIQVFDKKTGRLKKSLEQKLEIFFWKFSASRDFLIAYQGRGSVCRVYCWDRRKDYRLQVVRGPGLPISELSFINDHMLLGEHVNPSGKKLLGLRLDLDQEQLKFNWCSKTEHHLYSTTGSFIITCRSIPGAGGENDHAAVEILEKETGKKVHELTFDCGMHDSPKGLAYSSPLGIALMCRVDEAAEEGWLSFTVVDSKLFFFDMAHGFVIREIGIDYAKYFGLNSTNIRLWCDPPIGTLLMAAHGVLNPSNKLLAFNLLEILHKSDGSEQVVEPHRIFDVEGSADADAIAVSNQELVHAKIDERTMTVSMVKRSFWGGFKFNNF